MVSKVERERAALDDAEKELKERRRRLAELEEEEEQKALGKLVKRIGRSRAIEILELSLQVKPKLAVERLRRGSSETSQAAEKSAPPSNDPVGEEG